MTDPKQLPRIEYKKILYATDLSEAGRLAFPHAASIANRYAAKLTVFHVVETEEFERYLVGYISEDLWDQIKKRNLQEARDIIIGRKKDDVAIRDAVDQFCQDTLTGVEQKPYVAFDVAVETGDPVEKITAKARNDDYDLIVMGNHGRRALKEAVIGSTAWRVLHHSKIPVMVVWLPDVED
ncbi:MAG: universal stress protein [Gammaproteobacteria bacterium]|nr:universal stress protein [Gammaproteobacteria bacterium]